MEEGEDGKAWFSFGFLHGEDRGAGKSNEFACMHAFGSWAMALGSA